jgi:hypothetical protein
MKTYIAILALVILYEIIRWGTIGVYRDVKLLIKAVKELK